MTAFLITEAVFDGIQNEALSFLFGVSTALTLVLGVAVGSAALFFWSIS
jgi:hypothetical protein